MVNEYTSTGIICTKDRLEDIHLIFDSLITATSIPDQLIIVDSSSDNKVDELMKEKYSHLISSLDYLYIKDSPGLTHQRNTGIKSAKGEIIHFLEDDIVIENNYFEEIVYAFNKYPEVMGITGVIKNFTDINILHQVYNRLFLLPTSWRYENTKIMSSHFGVTNNEIIIDSYVNRLRGVSSYRSQVFINHLFDENLTGYCAMEDLDFSFRLSKEYKLLQTPSVVFRHYPSKHNRLNINNYYLQLKNNQKYLYKKNMGDNTKFGYYWSRFGLFVLYKLIYQIFKK